MNLVRMLCIWVVVWSSGTYAASLEGSHESLERQNAEAERAGLVYIESDEQLALFKRLGWLVKIPENVPWIKVDSRLPEKFRWLRPAALTRLEFFALGFYGKFGRPLQVNSAVRTLEHQGFLRLINTNAAAQSGARRSVHPTGAAFDIAKIGRTKNELDWLRKELLAAEKKGSIEATEERIFQLVFHIMVFEPAIQD